MNRFFLNIFKKNKSFPDSSKIINSDQTQKAINDIVDIEELRSNGEYFYVRGWSTFSNWQNKMLRSFGNEANPYLDNIWKSIKAKNLKIRPEYLPSSSKPTSYTNKKKNNSARYIPAHVKKRVYERDEGKCVVCGSKKNLHFDHIIPLSKGGSSKNPDNIQILCDKHNLSKGNSFKY